MSWVYLPGLAEACLPPSCLAGAPFAPSRSIRTVSASSRSDSATGSSNRSRCGTISERLTAILGVASSTSSPAGSPARTSQAQPGEVQGSTAIVRAYGLRCSASLARYGLRMSLPKTPRSCELKDWTGSLQGLPTWGSMRRGVCSDLGTLARPVEGTECGLWPAPRAMMGPKRTWGISQNPSPNRKRPREGVARVATVLAEVRRFGAAPRTSRVEWLMGWPIGWSASEPLATDRFQQWLRSHGVCSRPSFLETFRATLRGERAHVEPHVR